MTTHTVKTILAAMDNSQDNSALFKEALSLASSLRAQVVVVSITPEYEGNMNRLFINDANNQLKAPFQEILREADEYANSLGLHLQTIHRIGKPYEEIIAVAYEEHADIIMLGCAKRLQVERILSGRNMVEVITHGPCDVLLMPGDKELKFDRILVGIDGSPASKEAGERALDLAGSYGSEVHALFVTDIAVDSSLRYGVSRDAEKKGWVILKDFIEQGKRRDVSVIASIRGHLIEECLAQYALEKNIHLTILGSQARSLGLDIFCGSVVERIISLTPCPVLVTKKRI
ncbi:MAG: nucleotide-binding universal stress UspA family protein [Desulforhopalus sp.]|jgi:nucleotide-binding universal stress UspA family protein